MEIETPTETIGTQPVEQKESIKIIRGQRGGYGWEVRILSLDVDKLKEVDDKLKSHFSEEGA